jgi:NADPH-dependent 2,4-dienoyl-CoA reductase/sulfur reductase-like enzyme
MRGLAGAHSSAAALTDRALGKGESVTYRDEARELPVYGSYDVVVVGGGCAGFAAALAAARNGAETLVVERFPFFGGTATASLMACINGFRNQVEPEVLQTTKGIGEELVLRLKAIDGIGEPAEGTYPHKPHSNEKGDLSYCYVVDTEKLKYVMLDMMR